MNIGSILSLQKGRYEYIISEAAVEYIIDDWERIKFFIIHSLCEGCSCAELLYLVCVFCPPSEA